MFGYEMSWASFNVIEVMSSPKFAHKRVAYLVAAQSFSPETDVLMLATNLIKKVRGGLCGVFCRRRPLRFTEARDRRASCPYLRTSVRATHWKPR